MEELSDHTLNRYAKAAAEYERYVAAHPDDASRVEAMSLFRAQVGTLLKTAKQADGAHLESEIDELVSRRHGLEFRR